MADIYVATPGTFAVTKNGGALAGSPFADEYAALIAIDADASSSSRSTVILEAGTWDFDDATAGPTTLSVPLKRDGVLVDPSQSALSIDITLGGFAEDYADNMGKSVTLSKPLTIKGELTGQVRDTILKGVTGKFTAFICHSNRIVWKDLLFEGWGLYGEMMLGFHMVDMDSCEIKNPVDATDLTMANDPRSYVIRLDSRICYPQWDQQKWVNVQKSTIQNCVFNEAPGGSWLNGGGLQFLDNTMDYTAWDSGTDANTKRYEAGMYFGVLNEGAVNADMSGDIVIKGNAFNNTHKFGAPDINCVNFTGPLERVAISYNTHNSNNSLKGGDGVFMLDSRGSIFGLPNLAGTMRDFDIDHNTYTNPAFGVSCLQGFGAFIRGGSFTNLSETQNTFIRSAGTNGVDYNRWGNECYTEIINNFFHAPNDYTNSQAPGLTAGGDAGVCVYAFFDFSSKIVAHFFPGGGMAGEFVSITADPGEVVVLGDSGAEKRGSMPASPTSAWAEDWVNKKGKKNTAHPARPKIT